MGPLHKRPHDPLCDEFSCGAACEAAGGGLGRAEAKALVSPVEACSADASGKRDGSMAVLSELKPHLGTESDFCYSSQRRTWKEQLKHMNCPYCAISTIRK